LFGEAMKALGDRLGGEALDNRLKDLDTPDPLNEIVDIEPEKLENFLNATLKESLRSQ